MVAGDMDFKEVIMRNITEVDKLFEESTQWLYYRRKTNLKINQAAHITYQQTRKTGTQINHNKLGKYSS